MTGTGQSNRRLVVLLLLFVTVLAILNYGWYFGATRQHAAEFGLAMRDVLPVDEPAFRAALGSRLATYRHLGRYVSHTGLGFWLVSGAGIAAGILAFRRHGVLSALLPPFVAVAWIPSSLRAQSDKYAPVGSFAEAFGVEVAEAVAPMGLAVILALLVAVIARRAANQSLNRTPPASELPSNQSLHRTRRYPPRR